MLNKHSSISASCIYLLFTDLWTLIGLNTWVFWNVSKYSVVVITFDHESLGLLLGCEKTLGYLRVLYICSWIIHESFMILDDPLLWIQRLLFITLWSLRILVDLCHQYLLSVECRSNIYLLIGCQDSSIDCDEYQVSVDRFKIYLWKLIRLSMLPGSTLTAWGSLTTSLESKRPKKLSLYFVVTIS